MSAYVKAITVRTKAGTKVRIERVQNESYSSFMNRVNLARNQEDTLYNTIIKKQQQALKKSPSTQYNPITGYLNKPKKKKSKNTQAINLYSQPSSSIPIFEGVKQPQSILKKTTTSASSTGVTGSQTPSSKTKAGKLISKIFKSRQKGQSTTYKLKDGTRKIVTKGGQTKYYVPENTTFKSGGVTRDYLTPSEYRGYKQGKREEKIEALSEKTYKKLGIAKNENKGNWNIGNVAKVVARTPLEMLSGAYTIGGRLGTFADAVYQKKFKELGQTAKETPKAVIQSYDLRRPEGWVNLILTAGMIKGIQSSKVARTGVNKQLKSAKITKAKVKISKGTKGKVKVTTTGELKLPKVKYAGKTFKSQKVSFQEVKLIKKGAKPQAFSAKSVTKFGLGKRIKIVKGKIKGTRQTTKPIEGTRGQGSTTTTAGKYKFKTGKLRSQKGKFASVSNKGKTSSVLRSKGRNTIIESKLKNIKQPSKSVSTYELSSYIKSVPKTRAITKLKSSLKSIRNQIRTGKNLSSKQLKSLGSKAIKIGKALDKISPKRMGKKGQLSIGRGKGKFKPYDSGALTKGAGKSNVEAILKDMNKKLNALKKKPSIKSKGMQKPKNIQKPKLKISNKLKRPSLKDFNPNFIFAQAKTALLPKILVIPPPLNIGKPIYGGQVRGGSKGGSGAIPSSPEQTITSGGGTSPDTGGDSPSGTSPDTGGDTTSGTGTGTSTTTTNIYNQFFSSAGVASVPFINRFVPFAGGLPFSSPSGKGGIFSIGGNSLPKQISYQYNADLFSRIYGVKAKGGERAKLLAQGRTFSGLEVRKQV